MSTAAGADAVPPEATACWCCGTSYPELFLLHLNSRPDAVACLRCGEFLGRRARRPSRRADPAPWRAIRATIRARHPARERDQLATRGIRLGIRFRSAGSHPLDPDSDLRHDRQGSASHPDSGGARPRRHHALVVNTQMGNPTGDALKAIVSVRDADPPTGSQPRCRSTSAGAPDHPRQPLAFVAC